MRRCPHQWPMSACLFFLSLYISATSHYCHRVYPTRSFVSNRPRPSLGLSVSRVCTMRLFFLNFLADSLKSHQISLPVGKRHFFHFDYFSGCSTHFWPLNSPKTRKCPNLSNRCSYEVLWPLILTGTWMFLYVFHTDHTLKINRSAPKSQKW